MGNVAEGTGLLPTATSKIFNNTGDWYMLSSNVHRLYMHILCKLPNGAIPHPRLPEHSYGYCLATWQSTNALLPVEDVRFGVVVVLYEMVQWKITGSRTIGN